MVSRALFASGQNEWTTPPALFRALDDEFAFDVDLAASSANALCARYYTASDCALAAPTWRTPGVVDVGFCNPPYAHPLQRRFIARARQERDTHGFTTVLLLPARTDTRAFHEHLHTGLAPQAGVEVRFLKGRLRFGGATTGAPFPSMVVVVRGDVTKGIRR